MKVYGILKRIMLAYVNVARYQPLCRGTYLDLPQKLKSKKAIVNVRNRDNECLKWAIRAALFPPRNEKDPQRPSKHPTNDGINYEGIDFTTPVKQIDRLEKQNNHLAINIFGWENDCVIVHRLSNKETRVPRINLMLNRNAKHFCMMCLAGFSRTEWLENHKKYCNGVKAGRQGLKCRKRGKTPFNFKIIRNI